MWGGEVWGGEVWGGEVGECKLKGMLGLNLDTLLKITKFTK